MESAMDTRYTERIDRLRETKLAQTAKKVERVGRTMNGDDKGLIPMDGPFEFQAEPSHPNGGFYGPRAASRNYRRLLEAHPLYIDPDSTLAGGWMVSVAHYWKPWPAELDYSFLHEEQKKYGLIHGIGAPHHFLADISIGFRLGWSGLLNKIHYYRGLHAGETANVAEHAEFYDGAEDCVHGIQSIILRHAEEAARLAGLETDAARRRDLQRMADANRRIASDPPRTFYEAVQWTAWFILVLSMYNGAGAAVGAIDTFLMPFYERDRKQGLVDADEATFHLACLLLKDNFYCQIGGMWADGSDRTNEVSHLMLEATHLLKIPTNVCLRVHEKLDPELMRRAVTYLFEDRKNTPSFLGDIGMHEGFVRNGYPMELAVTRERAGCHWCGIPGREYTLNDCVKLNFAKVFEVAFLEMMDDKAVAPSIDELLKRYERHLQWAVDTLARGFDFHLENMWKVYPEMPMSILCHGPIEKGMDASHGHAVEFYNMCVDGSGIAVVADSFGALAQRIEKEGKLSWERIAQCLSTDYEGAEDVRRMMRATPRFGSGGSLADGFAVKLTDLFDRIVKAGPTPAGYWMIPGLFSWANTIGLGKEVGATPDGRHAFQPLNHGANPTPGFKEAGALTAMAEAVASVQGRYGNTTPIQLEIDPLLGKDEGGVENMIQFINTYCIDLKGTLMNINILDKETILAANEHPELYPDLVVRVTGFSAYFSLLSPDFRQLVVDRIIQG